MDMKTLPAAPRVHVLQVVGNGIVGGMETVVMRLVERLPRDRFRISALCPYEGVFSERLRALGLECMAMPMPEDPPWSIVQALCGLIEHSGVDVLHAHLPNAHLLAALAGKLTGRPVLATIHGRQLGMAELEVHRAAGTHLCTVCRHSQLHALGVGADPARLNCIPNGVDTTLFSPAPQAAPAPSAGGDQAPALRIGFVGRLSPEKAPEAFVRAALLLRDRLPYAHFVIYGDGPLRPTVQALVARYQLESRLEMAGVHEDMPAVYRGLDVLVSTSNSEAMPLAVMEAMASGLPVVATRVGGVPDLVAHGSTGWLVEAGNIDGMAASIAQLCENPADRLRMGAAGRARMVAGFDLRDSVAATGDLLLRLASRHPQAAIASLHGNSGSNKGGERGKDSGNNSSKNLTTSSIVSRPVEFQSGSATTIEPLGDKPARSAALGALGKDSS